MGLRNSADSWGWPARLMHWVMAVLVLFMLGLGLWVGQVLGNDPEQVLQRFLLTQLHKSWGTVAFVLICLRLGWRALNRAPDLPATMSQLERRAARLGHGALYLLLVLMPLSGWLMASASPLQETYGFRNLVFGLAELPDPLAGSEAVEGVLRIVHLGMGILLALLVAGHVAAALKHHFRDRDRVLRRMIAG